MKIRPLHDRVIVKRLEGNAKPPPASSSPTPRPKSPTKAKSSPSATARSTKTARCVALDVKVGDRVLFGKYSGQTVKVEGEELLVMREEDIMGVIEVIDVIRSFRTEFRRTQHGS